MQLFKLVCVIVVQLGSALPVFAWDHITATELSTRIQGKDPLLVACEFASPCYSISQHITITHTYVSTVVLPEQQVAPLSPSGKQLVTLKTEKQAMI